MIIQDSNFHQIEPLFIKYLCQKSLLKTVHIVELSSAEPKNTHTFRCTNNVTRKPICERFTLFDITF